MPRRNLLQVASLRSLLKKAQSKQVVYLEVAHWTQMAHVKWEDLDQAEHALLEKHFHRCYAVEPYIRRKKKLPPRVPSQGAYDFE